MRTTILSEERDGRHSPGQNPPSVSETGDHCPACGAELEPDQEWCLECGAARTVIHTPPDWRIGLLVMLGVIAVVVIVAAVVWP